MKKISEKLELPPDILEGATIVNVYGNQSALVENYKSIIEYSPNQIKLQGKHVKLLIEGEHLEIDRFTLEDCKIRGNIQLVHYIQT
ncbi:MAG: YabP/YqfC family sporulation protein [Lachnospiraceae bacterium]|nr:YabP/YqfC family sporulation protein [Lachnospiraceae bacterium]